MNLKRWSRPIAYSLILVLGVLAVFGDEGSPHGDTVVQAAPVRVEHGGGSGPSLPALSQREATPFPQELFVADPVPQPPTLAPVVEPTPAPAPKEPKILGWMLSEAVPYVFVDWEGASHTLKPSETLDDAYRFDGIDDGFADFTHLPTGQTRQYVVTDPALLD